MRVLGKTLAVGALTAAAAVLAAPGASAQAGAPCGPAAKACIDLSANRTWLMEDGVVTYGPAPITSGRPGYETPPGQFRVTWKNIDHWSSAYDAPMPYSVFFTKTGIAFHEGSLTELSHGCIHLSRDVARTYFNTLVPGDLVQVVP
jgi:lipoprotein-anchoring transpeptidase ErfK/SrfK